MPDWYTYDNCEDNAEQRINAFLSKENVLPVDISEYTKALRLYSEFKKRQAQHERPEERKKLNTKTESKGDKRVKQGQMDASLSAV